MNKGLSYLERKSDFAQLSVLAGHIPPDVEQILYENPVEAPSLLRETFGEYAAHPAGPGLIVGKNEEVPGPHKKEKYLTASSNSKLAVDISRTFNVHISF